jgi:lysophospholipase L1-like esterase
VAILGDSIVEALQVADDATFAAQLERLLGVEVLNFGISGYGPAQAWRLLEHEVRSYAVNTVVYVLFTENDVRNSVGALDGQPLLPYPVVNAHGGLDFTPPGKPPALKTVLARWSATYRWGQRDVWPHVVKWRTARRAARPTPDAPLWETAWDLTDRALVALHRSAQRANARFVVAVVPPESDTTATERRLARLLERRAIPVVSLVTILRSTRGAYYPIDGHLTPLGHGEVARQLAPVIKAAMQTAPATRTTGAN